MAFLFFTFNFAFMPNHYFQFKQFRIEQDRCAMKVCTDSCLFGAWIKVDENVDSILDIGTGTGLLSLMLAQKSTAAITGIEIDEDAFLQNKENFENSIWKERLSVYAGDVKSYPFTQKFDFIVCNPPFYEHEKESVAAGEKMAKHSSHLTLQELLRVTDNLLTENGKFAILLPYYRKDEIEYIASKHQFFPEKTLYIKQTPAHSYFRYAAIFSKTITDSVEHMEFPIKEQAVNYSKEAHDLLQPYYLYL